MGALATPQAAVFGIAHLFRVATRQHLRHQAFVVGRLVARMGVGKRVPVLGKDPLEDTPVPRGLYQHRLAPSWGHQLVAVKRVYHASAASSTPSRPGPGNLSPASFILELWGLLDRKNEKSYAMNSRAGTTRSACMPWPTIARIAVSNSSTARTSTGCSSRCNARAACSMARTCST